MLVVKNIASLKGIFPALSAFTTTGQVQPRLSLEDFHVFLKSVTRIDSTCSATPFVIALTDEVSSRSRLIDLQAALPAELADAADLVDRALRLDDAEAAKAAFARIHEDRFDPKVESNDEKVERFEFVVEDLESGISTSIHCLDFIYASEALAFLGGLVKATEYVIDEIKIDELDYALLSPASKILKDKMNRPVHVEGNLYTFPAGSHQSPPAPQPR